jgi:hypothetical protein
MTESTALSRAEEECAVAGDSGEGKGSGILAEDGRGPTRDEQIASDGAEFNAAGAHG